MCVCVCVVLVLLLFITVCDFKGTHECVSGLILYSVIVFCDSIIVSHYARDLERTWICAIHIPS